MNEITKAILEYIRRNRVSSVEVADALGKEGVLEGLNSLSPGHHVAGVLSYIPAYGESNWPVHDAAQHIPEERIVYVDAIGCGERAIFGDIVAKYLLLYKRSLAVVVNGRVRDVHRLRKEEYPIWTKGGSPLGCFNHNVALDDETSAVIGARRAALEGSIIVCDDSGCTVIESSRLTDETLKRLEFIELQEDIWYFCIDTLKLSTFETICEKAYLKHRELLPETLREQLEAMEKALK